MDRLAARSMTGGLPFRDADEQIMGRVATAWAAMDWSASRPLAAQGNAPNRELTLFGERKQRFFRVFCIGLPVSSPVTSREPRLDKFAAVLTAPPISRHGG